MSAAAAAARDKLNAAELRALRAELRREVRAELAARPARAPRVRELPELAACARRMVNAVARQAAVDVEGLAELAKLRDAVDAAMQTAVDGARAADHPSGHPYSWTDVGRVLGMTRQSAQQRFGRSA